MQLPESDEREVHEYFVFRVVRRPTSTNTVEAEAIQQLRDKSVNYWFSLSEDEKRIIYGTVFRALIRLAENIPAWLPESINIQDDRLDITLSLFFEQLESIRTREFYDAQVDHAVEEATRDLKSIEEQLQGLTLPTDTGRKENGDRG